MSACDSKYTDANGVKRACELESGHTEGSKLQGPGFYHMDGGCGWRYSGSAVWVNTCEQGKLMLPDRVLTPFLEKFFEENGNPFLEMLEKLEYKREVAAANPLLRQLIGDRKPDA